MKAIQIIVTLLFSFLMNQTVLNAQNNSEDIIFKAMNDELNRNMSKLKIGKHAPPFFISYQLSDAKTLNIRATLGAVRYSSIDPRRFQSVRLMVGDYALNDENFNSGSFSTGGGGNLPLPIDNDYNAIRRSFWMASDQSYKRAVESYDQKISAMKQQNKSDEEKPDDYSRITPVQLILKSIPVKYDKNKWETVARDISGEFKSYGQISNSSVNLSLMNASVYITSSEGTKLRIPFNIAYILINANLQAEDGEYLNDHLLYYALSPEKLPGTDKIKQDISHMAQRLLSLAQAPAIKESYSGPVIFEGEAVGEICAQKFGGNGLIATRNPLFSQGGVNRIDEKINQKICSENISIKETPKLKTFNSVPLIGTFEIDAEGVVPKDELILVEKGILKTLLNDRVPTSKIKESNGHRRLGVLFGYSQKAPGILNISYQNGESAQSLRNTVLKEAEKTGLEFIYLIRKLEVANPGQIRYSMMCGRSSSVLKPIGIYKVIVKTGEEQLIRSSLVSDFQLNKFKDIMIGSKEQEVYNTMVSSLFPTSFIVPQILVFNDVSIEKDRSTKPKLPMVPNPFLSQK